MADRKVPKNLNHEPEAVEWALRKSGLTKTEVAARLGCSPGLITEILQGTRNLTNANLIRLAEIFNCPVVVLERKRKPESPGAATGDPKAPAEAKVAA